MSRRNNVHNDDIPELSRTDTKWIFLTLWRMLSRGIMGVGVSCALVLVILGIRTPPLRPLIAWMRLYPGFSTIEEPCSCEFHARDLVFRKYRMYRHKLQTNLNVSDISSYGLGWGCVHFIDMNSMDDDSDGNLSHCP